MHSYIKNRSYIFFVSLFLSTSLLAQIRDSTLVGVVSGSVKDTAFHFFLQSATVSINKASDGSLVAYTLTNGLGEFRLKALPTGLLLRISISYIGYRTNSRDIRIPIGQRDLSIGEIDLEKRTDRSEDSVIVTPPPVRMNGDTLEFSAAAFSLDKNAVAEDLLRKLPGVIVWGDGTITVNGKQISKLLVDGKPFFGGDTKIATQNIPKNAIEKIQVYQEQPNLFDPLDSITTINIKLGKNKHSGYFGAFSAGEGTDGRYELGAASSLFSPGTQFGVAAQSNNINKIANDIGTLLRNNTYKGVGVRVEYQPDFDLQGRNQPSSGGFIFSHDLIPGFDAYEKNRLSASSFVKHNINETLKNIQTASYIGKDSTLTLANTDHLRNITTAGEYAGEWLKHKDENSISLEGAFRTKTGARRDSLQNLLYGPDGALVSGDRQYDSSTYALQTASLRTSFEHKGFSSTSTHRLTDWSIVHSISLESGKKDSSLQTVFTSVPDPALDRSYDRKYNDNVHILRQSLSMRLGDFSSWLFADSRWFSNLHMELENELKFDISKQDNSVKDRDPLTSSYIVNDYLTANNRYTVLNELPDLRFGRGFMNVLANRYTKEFSVYVDAQAQIYAEKNVATHSFQEFGHTYHYFVPKISMQYYHFQYGDFLDKYDLNLDLSYDYPTVDQRVPLVDSSSIYSIREGNPMLTPMENYGLSAKFSHDSYRSKNTFAYGAGLQGGIKSHYFADSALIDPSGRYTYYTVNLNGYRYLSATLFFNKAFVYNAHQFQVNFGSVILGSKTPGYLQDASGGKAIYNVTDLFTNSDTLSLTYTYKDLFALNLVENISLFKSVQKGLFNSVFTNELSLTRLGVGVNLTKKLSLNSNVTYTVSMTSGAAKIGYTIWNASMAYRFLPGNNLELKASALDLLNQNTGILNYGNNLSFTHGTVNMLRQYFMMTVTYFPRKFGKSQGGR